MRFGDLEWTSTSDLILACMVSFLVVWMPDWLYRIPWSCAQLCLLLAVAGFYFRWSRPGAHWHVLCHGCRCKLQHQTCEGLGHGCACHCWHDGGFIVVLFICSFYCCSPPCMLSCWQTLKYEAYGKFVLTVPLEILTCQWIWNYLEYRHYYHVQTCPKTMIVNGFRLFR